MYLRAVPSNLYVLAALFTRERPTRVFISYAHADIRHVERDLPRLETVAEIWSDSKLRGGQRWREEIRKRIKWCDKMIVYWCCHSGNSIEVARELKQAAALNKPIAAFRLCDYPMPQSLREFHWVNIKDLPHDCIQGCPSISRVDGIPPEERIVTSAISDIEREGLDSKVDELLNYFSETDMSNYKKAMSIAYHLIDFYPLAFYTEELRRELRNEQ